MIVFLSLFVLSACSISTSKDPVESDLDNDQNLVEEADASDDEVATNGSNDIVNDSEEGNDSVMNEQETEDPNEVIELDMMSYFLPDSYEAHFEGTGNEFAELDILVSHPYDGIVMIHENNGGVLIKTLYKVENDKIFILNEEPVETIKSAPPLEELEQMQVQSVYLQKPLEVGATFESWTIVETDAIVETLYQTFENAVVIEEQDGNFINRKSFVKDYGEVKRESIMKVTDEPNFIITSLLETIKEP